MGMFDRFKGKRPEEGPPEMDFPAVLGAPARGIVVAMEALPDPVFSQGVLGQCCGIEPEDGNIYAPMGGRISQLADTFHAVGVEAGGIELLIHVGVDTVEMGGDGFFSRVKVGQRVEQGQLLLTADLGKIRAAGHPAAVITAVTNSGDFSSVRVVADGAVRPGDALMKIER